MFKKAARFSYAQVFAYRTHMHNDAEHPMDITMSRVRSASDTCDIYFTYTKVNHLLFTCSLDSIEDGILLDTPLVCIHRYHRSTTDDEEECKRKCTPTPSTREAWKQRRKKTVQVITKGKHSRTSPITHPLDYGTDCLPGPFPKTTFKSLTISSISSPVRWRGFFR